MLLKQAVYLHTDPSIPWDGIMYRTGRCTAAAGADRTMLATKCCLMLAAAGRDVRLHEHGVDGAGQCRRPALADIEPSLSKR